MGAALAVVVPLALLVVGVLVVVVVVVVAPTAAGVAATRTAIPAMSRSELSCKLTLCCPC